MDNQQDIALESANTGEKQDAPTETTAPATETSAPLSMFPITEEEVTNTIEKDGISFIFESRSLSSVIRFIYTPIDGTFADIELEINSADPILPAEDGGVTIEIGGQEWPAPAEEVERHFVSCEQVGASVEARWQWKHGEELADFLYRFTIEGKSLIVEMEGGSGKATGVDLGQVIGAIHPRLISVPYFNLGEGYPHILCTSGVFISSFLDWNISGASGLSSPDTPEAQEKMKINGGCCYLPTSGGKRNPLHERWLITASRQFEEVLPALPSKPVGVQEELKKLLWYNVPSIPPEEESYVELYELLRTFKQWGMENVLINHSEETWHDGDGNATLTLDGAASKGGDDALGEYLEAVDDLGFPFSLTTNYRDVSSANPRWSQEMASLLSDGNPAITGPDKYQLKPDRAVSLASEHTRAIAEKYHNPAIFVTAHASLPPWDHVDFDSDSQLAGSWLAALRAQQAILSSQGPSQQGLAVGEGGHHWFFPGHLHGFLARQPGAAPHLRPLLVDFDLRYLHPFETDAGLGTPEQFFGGEIPPEEKNSRSSFFDRYLAATVAYGHAGLLLDPAVWGMAAAVKTYYLLRELQTHYLGVPVASIRYHHEGNMLETTDALVSGAYEQSQVLITYENGLLIYVNGSWEAEWSIEREEATYSLPPGSFLASGPDDLLVYSGDTGTGRIDYSRSSEYLYCDTRGNRMELGPITLDGAALVLQKKWEIDIFPFECNSEIEVDLACFLSDRRLPPLRLLAFRPDDDEPSTLNANASGPKISFQPTEEFYRYRVALPEWMVEPGR